MNLLESCSQSLQSIKFGFISQFWQENLIRQSATVANVCTKNNNVIKSMLRVFVALLSVSEFGGRQ